MQSDRIIHIPECESTNTKLIQLNTEKALRDGIGFSEGTILWSDFQSAGKGQRGNSWESENGKNLLFSLLLYPSFLEANKQFYISQVIALGIAKSLNKYTTDISIKWPNDIYWKNEKISGTLIENSLVDSRIASSICGIGININQTLFLSNAPNPTSLKTITTKEYNLNILLNEIADNIMHFYSLLKEDQTQLIRQTYKDNLFRKDGFHYFNDGNDDFEAKIKDIEESGILVLESKDTTERKFAFKEVKYILQHSN